MIVSEKIQFIRKGAIPILSIIFTLHASGATIVHTFTDQHIGLILTSTGDQEVVDQEFNFSQSVQQFNPTLGELTSIKFDVRFNFRISGDTGAGPMGGNMGGGIGGVLLMGGVSYGGAGDSMGDGNSAGNALLAEFSPFNVTTLAVGGFNIPEVLTVSTGTGTVLWEFANNDDFGIDFFTSRTASGQLELIADRLEITYGYNPIPEPSAALLLSCGAGIVLLRRRRSN
jgi:hypothetical protein